MVKELDALLDSIEEPGGFYDASVTARKPSVEELEEGIWLLSNRCHTWTVSFIILLRFFVISLSCSFYIFVLLPLSIYFCIFFYISFN